MYHLIVKICKKCHVHSLRIYASTWYKVLHAPSHYALQKTSLHLFYFLKAEILSLLLGVTEILIHPLVSSRFVSLFSLGALFYANQSVSLNGEKKLQPGLPFPFTFLLGLLKPLCLFFGKNRHL